MFQSVWFNSLLGCCPPTMKCGHYVVPICDTLIAASQITASTEASKHLQREFHGSMMFHVTRCDTLPSCSARVMLQVCLLRPNASTIRLTDIPGSLHEHPQPRSVRVLVGQCLLMSLSSYPDFDPNICVGWKSKTNAKACNLSCSGALATRNECVLLQPPNEFKS